MILIPTHLLSGLKKKKKKEHFPTDIFPVFNL